MDLIRTTFIGFCMLAVTASMSVMLFVTGGLGLPEAVIAAVSVMLVFALLYVARANNKVQSQLSKSVLELKLANTALAEELAQAKSKMDDVDGLDMRIEAAGTRMQERILGEVDDLIESRVEVTKSTLVSEMQVIEKLVLQLASGVADSGGRRTVNKKKTDRDVPHNIDEGDSYAGFEAPVPDTPLGHLDETELLELVRDAVESNRVDIYLQPIVTLPQRKLRHYEALAQLRDTEGSAILPEDYMRVAGKAGVLTTIDNFMLFRSVQIVRKLASRNRALGIFCNMSDHSLIDSDFFPQFLDFMTHNRALQDALFFELPQAVVYHADDAAHAGMRALADLGFKFSMDHVADMDLDLPDLAARGVKFVKIEAARILAEAERPGAKIHPADLPVLMTHHGLTLIAEHIEDEPTVLDILDYDISLAQGYLFSEPRPVREESFDQSGPAGDLRRVS